MLALFASTPERCRAAGEEYRAPVQPFSSGQLSATMQVSPVWEPLLRRLAGDGISGPDVEAMFAGLGGDISQEPMGRKMRELYTSKFLRQPPDPSAPKTPRPRLYKDVVTAENAALCRNFLQQYAPAFALAELRYGVPKEIAVSLLFVETRLGTVLGKVSAFYTLASMASCSRPEDIGRWLPQLPGYESRLDWMTEVMPRRSDWAYKELRALIVFTRAQGTDPLTMPGSIYGAVGMCQFMPSNLAHYGADGDGDGVVDLFTVPDAVASLSRYLALHGWKAGISRQRQHALLKTYNRADIYANTILALSDVVLGVATAPAPSTAGKASVKASQGSRQAR